MIARTLSSRARGALLACLMAASLGSAAQPDPSAANPDILIADFEGADYGGWTTTGSAFGSGPARGTLPGQMAVDGYEGSGLVNSFLGGDSATGTLRSPPFRIERRYIQFLIGGGMHPGQTCINLLLDGRVVRTATGSNDRPGGSERLEPHQWDVAELHGSTVSLEIVDQATGGWGHINIDHIVQTDRRLPGWISDASRDITLDRRYLHVPVRNGAPRRWLSIHADGKLLREFEVELADGEPDWWAFIDLQHLRGKQLTLVVDKLREGSPALEAISQDDEIRGAANLYREPLRPQFHFSSRRGWNNDPNGLVHYRGEYHLFYQHNPVGWSWGNMHWGHAVSPDLVHWTELGDALHPDELGTMFSGSAVVDSGNTAGFKSGDEDPIVLFYTAAGGTSRMSKDQPFTQCIAYSNDRGRTWTKYEGNPVLGHVVGGNRDPKVIWHEPTRTWIMALYLDGDEFALFGSPNLKKWEELSRIRIPGSSECPDFFPLPIEGRKGDSRWILYGGNGLYLVGTFDGRTFTPDSGPHPMNHGNCFYASQTFSDVPDGRRILVTWGQIAMPGMPFNQMIGLPVVLTLHDESEGPRLRINPIDEIAKLRTRSNRITNLPLAPEPRAINEAAGELLDLSLEIAPGGASEIVLNVRGVPIRWSAANHELACLGRRGPLPPDSGRLRLRVLVDRTSIDIFGNDGRLYMPMGSLLDPANTSVTASAVGDGARIEKMEVHILRSAWR